MTYLTMGRIGPERLARFRTLTRAEVIDDAKVGVGLAAVKKKGTHPQPDVVHEPAGVPGFPGARSGYRLQKVADGIPLGDPPLVASVFCESRV